MWMLLDGAAKVTVLLLIPYVVAVFLRRASASVWHVLWAAPLIWSLVLPGMLVALPAWHVLPRWAGVEVKGAQESGARNASAAKVRGDAGLPVAAASGAGLPAARPEGPMDARVKGAGDVAAGGAVPMVRRAGRLPSAESVVLGVYFGGVVICLMPVLAAVVWLRRMEKRAVVLRAGRVFEIFRELVRGGGLEGRVRLLESGEPTMPMTWGLMRARILLPAEAEGWPAERVRCVLLHELAHVRRRDVVTGLLGRVAGAMYWFHPLAWVAAAQMRGAAERACDDLVLGRGVKASVYAEELMGLTRRLTRVRMAGLTAFHAIAMARGGRSRGSALHGRVKAILDGGRNRAGVSGRMEVGMMVGLLAVVLPLATLAVRGQGAGAAGRDNNGAAVRPAGNSVSGMVLDEQDRPAAGVVVTRQFVDRRFQIDSIASATTGADGRFTMALDAAAKPDGNYTAFSADRSRAGYLSFTQGTVPTELQITLRAARVLPVNVVDGGGRPVAGATAVAGVTSPLASATTDGAGKAALALPADAPLEFVEAYKAGAGMDYALFWRKEELRTDPYRMEPDAKGPVTLKLDGAKPVTVTVVDGNNQPLAGATVRPWTFTRPNRGSLLNVRMPAFLRRTDASGRVTFDFFPADNMGGIQLLATKDGMISTEPWSFDPVTSGDQMTVMLKSLVHVRGKVVTRDGAPAGGTTVYVSGRAYVVDQFSRNTVTSADGSFSFDVYPDHFYVFMAQKDHDVSPVASMTIRAVSPAPIVLTLQPGIRVFGTLTAGEERKPVADDQIVLIVESKLAAESPDAQALPNPRKEAGPISNGISRSAKSKADGSYEFYASPGSYALSANIFYADVRNFDLGNVAEFKADLHTTQQPNGPREFHGRVVKDAQGEPAAEAKLKGMPDGDEVNPDLTGVSDKDGAFTMNRAATEMWVHAVSQDRSAAALVLVGRQQDQMTITLAPAASARGRLVDAQGKAMASKVVFLEVYPPGPGHANYPPYIDRVITDKEGIFVLRGLAVGVQYTLRASNVGLPTQIAPRRVEELELGDVRVGAPPGTMPARAAGFGAPRPAADLP